MSIFQRLKTTMTADAHGMLDAIEDRALLLRQYVRDAETELARKRGKLQLLELELRALAKDEKATAAELSDLEADAQVALGAENDELSRFALKGVLLRRARQRRQAERREELSRESQELSRVIAEQSDRYDTLKERVEAELQATGAGASAVPGDVISDEQVELELLRRKGRAPEAR